MSFISFQFLIFFPIVTLLYFVIPHRYRWGWLLAASCYFYMVFIPVYIFILLFLILIDFFSGILIEKSESQRAKKRYLIVSIVSTCLVLFIFKYFNFFNGIFNNLANCLHLSYPIGIMDVILPIGLSFHTFQSLSYVIEVYRGNQKAERHFGIYALYVMFYPQLVAGPIERPQNLLHQFRENHFYEYQRVTDGLKLMVWGFFKKVVIANRLGFLVDLVYGNPQEFKGISLIMATVFFAFQIYCDFSGYSDIAIGAAQVMGFKLMDNFNRPYFSKSISEFWKRWHISLSTWFRDYFYIPLGGNQGSWWYWQRNLFLTFLVSGLWHGANWTYVIWGALNGFYLMFAIWTGKTRERIINLIELNKYSKLLKCGQVFITFSLICFSWIFFRAKNVTDAWYVVTHLFSDLDKFSDFYPQILALSSGRIDKAYFGISILSVMLMEYFHTIQRHGSIRHMLADKLVWFRWSLYYASVLTILFLGVFDVEKNFIYFQF